MMMSITGELRVTVSLIVLDPVDDVYLMHSRVSNKW